MTLKKVISGGQTGADRGGLNAALRAGIALGGWCPKGRLSEDGYIPELYPMIELPTASYPARTAKNVKESDGTVIFVRAGKIGRGTQLTINECDRQGKPYLLIEREPVEDFAKIAEETWKSYSGAVVRWIERHAIEVLNVAGTRHSKDALICDFACACLEDAFHRLGFVFD